MKYRFTKIIIVLLFVSLFLSVNGQQTRKISVQACGISFNMIYVPAGTFTMGATTDEDYDEREHPSHKVTITKGYYIGETEVTQALWEAVMENNPSDNVGKNNPVDNVSWEDCQAFISILNFITGKHFRLPTEAEWEFAAKGGNNSKGYIYSGSNHLDEVAWYSVNSGDKIHKDQSILFNREEYNSRTHEVKLKKPNELGIYDMSGNVCEWCEDGYAEYTSNHQYDPKGISTNNNKVKKGGDYADRSRNCRITHRYGIESDFCVDSDGFRLVLEE